MLASVNGFMIMIMIMFLDYAGDRFRTLSKRSSGSRFSLKAH